MLGGAHRGHVRAEALGEVLGVSAEAGVVIAEDLTTDGEASDVGAHRLDDSGELVAEDRALGFRG